MQRLIAHILLTHGYYWNLPYGRSIGWKNGTYEDTTLKQIMNMTKNDFRLFIQVPFKDGLD